MTQRSILITGAAGGVGRVSCNGLRARGWRVVGFDQAADPSCCDAYHRGQITDGAALARAAAGCEAVLHLAANPRTNADFLADLVDANIIGTWRVLEAAVAAGAQRAIVASSINAANGAGEEPLERIPIDPPDPGNPYGLSKVFSEDAARYFHRVHGLRTVAARIASFPRTPSAGTRLQQRAQDGRNEPDHYLSHDDWLRFLDCALSAEVGEATVYAVSRPRGESWPFDPEPGRQLLGYEPQDVFPAGLPDWVFSQEPEHRDRGPMLWRDHLAAAGLPTWSGDPQRVLVTGAAGAVGRHLGPALRAAGYVVVGLDRDADPGGYDAFHQAQITDRAALDAALAGCGALVHLAANPHGDASFDQLVEPNIRGLWTALDAARCAGTPRVVVASSIHAALGQVAKNAAPAGPELTDPKNPYGLTKVLAERAGRLFHRHAGMQVVALRLGWFPRGEEEVRRIAGRGPEVPYLSWDDCVGWFRAALEHPDPGYTLAYALSLPGSEPRYDLASSIADLGYRPRDCWPEGMPDALRALALAATTAG